MKNWRALLVAGLTALLAVATAAAQSYPNRPIRLVVPFPPGTASDFLGRTIGTALTERYVRFAKLIKEAGLQLQ